MKPWRLFARSSARDSPPIDRHDALGRSAAGRDLLLSAHARGRLLVPQTGHGSSRAASELGFDPSSTIVIGDKLSDIEFGQRAGATTILLSAKGPAEDATVVPDFIVKNLWETAQTIDELAV
jgi:hypothetical protein